MGVSYANNTVKDMRNVQSDGECNNEKSKIEFNTDANTQNGLL